MGYQTLHITILPVITLPVYTLQIEDSNAAFR